MVEVAQPPKTGGIAVQRHGFGENHRKNTPKISKRTKTIFRDCVKKSRSRGNLLRPIPTFFFFKSTKAPMPHCAGAQLNGEPRGQKPT
jgi:hypothetical protein